MKQRSFTKHVVVAVVTGSSFVGLISLQAAQKKPATGPSRAVMDGVQFFRDFEHVPYPFEVLGRLNVKTKSNFLPTLERGHQFLREAAARIEADGVVAVSSSSYQRWLGKAFPDSDTRWTSGVAIKRSAGAKETVPVREHFLVHVLIRNPVPIPIVSGLDLPGVEIVREFGIDTAAFFEVIQYELGKRGYHSIMTLSPDVWPKIQTLTDDALGPGVMAIDSVPGGRRGDLVLIVDLSGYDGASTMTTRLRLYSRRRLETVWKKDGDIGGRTAGKLAGLLSSIPNLGEREIAKDVLFVRSLAIQSR